jgi:hypothetical protein
MTRPVDQIADGLIDEAIAHEDAAEGADTEGERGYLLMLARLLRWAASELLETEWDRVIRTERLRADAAESACREVLRLATEYKPAEYVWAIREAARKGIGE